MSAEHRRVYIAFLKSHICLKRDYNGVVVRYPHNVGYRLTSTHDGGAWSIVNRYCV
jgi:hypothetical protein